MPFNLPISSFGQNPFGSGGNSNQIIQLIMQLVGQASSGRDEARQANESRYNDILELFGQNRQRTMDSLEGFGDQAITDTNKSYDDKRSELLTDLADRGLSGSTKRIAVESMTKRERDNAVNRIKDMLVENRNAADLGFTDRAAGVMERRVDAYPDTSNIGALVAQLAPLLNGGAMGGGSFASGNSRGPRSKPGTRRPPPAGYVLNQATGQYEQPSVASKVAAVNQQRSNAAAPQHELARRDGMIGLRKAGENGGLFSETDVSAALGYLQQMGWAEQNPNTVSTVPFQQVPYETQYVPQYGGGGYGGGQVQQPSYAYGSGQNLAYQQRLAEIGPKRRAYLNSNTYKQLANLVNANRRNGFGG